VRKQIALCQKTMVDFIFLAIPYLVLVSHLLLVLIVLAILFRNSWGKSLINFLAINSIVIVFAISASVILGSLYYSQILGFEPCILCWWQRVFLFPLPVILATALWKGKKDVFTYIVPLVALAGLVAFYQAYANLGGFSFTSCTAVGGACSKIYVKEFGYITIPIMSLTVSVYILVLAWINKTYSSR